MKIDRQEFLQELKLREQIRKAIRVIKERKLANHVSQLKEEARLRTIIRRLLKEEEGEGDERSNDGHVDLPVEILKNLFLSLKQDIRA